MYTIVVSIPEKLHPIIQPYRQKYDPLAEEILPNISLLKPFNFSEEPQTLYHHLEDIGDSHPPIKVSLMGWDVYRHKLSWICLPPISGYNELLDLRRSLLTGPLQPLTGQDDSYRPHVIIGRFAEQPALAQARIDLKHFEAQFVFRVTKMTLLHRESREDAWQTEAEFTLNATAMSAMNRR